MPYPAPGEGAAFRGEYGCEFFRSWGLPDQKLLEMGKCYDYLLERDRQMTNQIVIVTEP